MTELIVPAAEASVRTSPRTEPASVADTIRALAARHGVTYEPTEMDAFAADASRLSDAEVVPDAVEDLLQALTRADIITHGQRFALHAAYLRELPAE